jgi:hypothetical protein
VQQARAAVRQHERESNDDDQTVAVLRFEKFSMYGVEAFHGFNGLDENGFSNSRIPGVRFVHPLNTGDH